MIKSFRDKWLKDFYIKNKNHKKIPANLQDRLFRKLQLVDDATSDADLRVPPSNNFELLTGNLAGKYSIRVNKQYRLIFEWNEDQAKITDIYLDNHTYR